MIHYILICFILAILGTLAANPVLYFQIFKKRKEYREALKKYELEIKKENHSYIHMPDKTRYSIFISSPIFLIIFQVILFAFFFVISAFVLYFSEAVVIRFSTLLAYLWIPGIAQISNFIIIGVMADELCLKYVEDIFWSSLVIFCFFIAISSGINVHKGVYNYLHPFDNFTIINEVIKDCPKVDDSFILKESNIADGSGLKDPIYRNDHWIYPVVNYNVHVSSSGYIIVDEDINRIQFIYRDINYSPYLTSQNNVRLYLRRLYPNLVFFGDPTFQINPDGGDIYFCQFFGDYLCCRAGRELKGILLVNATTGEYEMYSIGNIPSWITGISF